MSTKNCRDSAGRKQPSKDLRKKRAVNGAKHRWKHKWQLVPGFPPSWSERSFANKLRHLVAAKKGGETTGRQIREQQRLFWRWYHGDCKAQLREPFKSVVETFERIEVAHLQRYGSRGAKPLAWDGFFAQMFKSYVLVACGGRKPADIERELWALYEKYMNADDHDLDALLTALYEYEDALEEKSIRLGMWRERMSRQAPSKNKKI
jgi:hypothetical protein